jgi:hypothetical protein
MSVFHSFATAFQQLDEAFAVVLGRPKGFPLVRLLLITRPTHSHIAGL